MCLSVIGLISGGKDSLFSLAHCLQNGHKIVALANLHPSYQEDVPAYVESADIDSFMYQTVGHSVIALYAEALQLPLYRRSITGTAKQTGASYDTSTDCSSDETEDMFLLVQDVLRQHPEANALSAGAILSSYQRTRVESVATRHGLTPLAYLWQYPALPPPVSRHDSLTSLLDDMALAGCDARIIKIASGGIRSNLLSTNVADQSTRMKLVSGLSKFFREGQDSALRGAVLGEGGEYETLALNGPTSLWKKCIQVEFTDMFDGQGGTVYSVFGSAKVTPNDYRPQADIPIPAPFDMRFAAIVSQTLSMNPGNLKPVYSTLQTNHAIELIAIHENKELHLQLPNITASDANLPPAEQLTRIITTTQSLMANGRVAAKSFRNVTSATLVLRSIDQFNLLNSVYSAGIWPKGLPNPPARVTIAGPLPDGVDVSLSLLFADQLDEPEPRKGLHVQSRSYWAPANIGPYSQAIPTPLRVSSILAKSDSLQQPGNTSWTTAIEIVHMAGQIPLVPASMKLSDGPFHEQAALALQHLWRVAQDRDVDIWAGPGVAYLACSDGSLRPMQDQARVAARTWILAHCINEKGLPQSCPDHDEDSKMASDEDVDIWDVQQRDQAFGVAVMNVTVGEHLHVLPEHSVYSLSKVSRLAARIKGRQHRRQQDRPVVPAFIAAQVSGLPRHAPIEWWSTGLAGVAASSTRSISRLHLTRLQMCKGVFLSGLAIEHLDDTASGETEPSLETTPSGLFTFFLTILIEPDFDSSQLSLLDVIQNVLFEQSVNVRGQLVTAHLYVNLSSNLEKLDALKSLLLMRRSTLIQCHWLWGSTCSRTAESGDYTAAMTNTDSDELKELAAAITVRVDVQAFDDADRDFAT